jgi:mannose-6-phosphate isomerase-like protein (cupin superfamily)
MAHVELDKLDHRREGVPVFGDLAYTTPWQRLDLITLAADQTITCGPAAEGRAGEQGHVVLEGAVTLDAVADKVDMRAHLRQAPGWLMGPTGCAHELTCQGSVPARVVRIQVDAEAAPHAEMQAGRFDPAALTWREAIHGGSGRIATRHVLRPEQFISCWTFLDHAILGPSSSLGYHYHDALEECFIVLAGKGHMTLEGQTFAVGPGSAVFQPIGAAHGLHNPGPADLEFVRIAVALPDEEYTTVDLDDDLRQRQLTD